MANDDWRDLLVWRCSEEDCGKQWGTWLAASPCPFCHCGSGRSTGFTCGELAAAAEKFGFDGDLPVHIPVPVPEVVQVSTLPRETWVGLPVFHPFSQEGGTPNWLVYDVGVIVDVFADPDLEDEFRCRFVYSVGTQNGTFLYAPSNLWVPKVLAKRLG